VENVEKVFREFGAQPEARPSPVIEGIKKEHDQSVGEVSPKVADLFAAGAATTSEHYEIASYEGLITMAKALGKPQAARLLETNMKQDQKMLTETKAIVRRLSNKAAKQSSAARGEQPVQGRPRAASAGANVHGCGESFSPQPARRRSSGRPADRRGREHDG
jgi:hypothetical protein